jgi:hypothetical protein
VAETSAETATSVVVAVISAVVETFESSPRDDSAQATDSNRVEPRHVLEVGLFAVTDTQAQLEQPNESLPSHQQVPATSSA